MIWWRTLWGGFRKGSGSSGKLTMGVRQVGNSEIESSVCGTGSAYAYDLEGRRTGVSGSFARTGTPQAASPATYNLNNQLTQWKGASLTYDANGNLTSDGTNTYTWNARNQLVSISGPVPASFQYDPFGRRVSKTIGGTTQYLYDGANPVQEISGSSASANLLAGGVDEYFQRTDSAGASNFLTDALGSTLALADSTGTLQTQYTFEPFGNTSITGAATTNSFAYTGRELDATGLYFYRARYYSPQLQRFASEDPIGFNGGGTNLYGYSGDSPTNLRDPSGRNSVSENLSWSWNATKSFFTGFSLSGRKEKNLNKCAGQLSQSFSLNPAPGNFLPDALLGNQFGTIAQAALGPDRGDALGQLAVDNPIPKASLNSLTQAGVAALPTGGTVYVANGNVVLGPWGPALDTSPAAVTIGDTAFGEGLLGGIELFEAGKLVFDAGVYIGALYVCAEQ